MKKLVQVIAILFLITAPVCAETVATWTLQGVASYAQRLFESVGSGTTTATTTGSGSGWLSGNATDDFSIPVWNSTTQTWTASKMLPSGINATESRQPLSITSGGVLQYLTTGGFSDSNSFIPTQTYPGDIGEYGYNVIIGTHTWELEASTGAASDTIRAAFDDNPLTYCRAVNSAWYYYPDDATLQTRCFYDAYDNLATHTGKGPPYPITGYAFQVGNTTTPGPASWDFIVKFATTSSNISKWYVIDSVTATSTISGGNWYYSTASFSIVADTRGTVEWLAIGFSNASGVTDIAEIKWLTGPVGEKVWENCLPPASFAAQSITFAPSSSVPTATGTVYADAGDVLRVRDQHGASSAILTSYPTWQDLRVSLLSTNAGGTNAPTPTVVRANGTNQGVFAYAFDKTTEQELYTSVQLPHGIVKDHAHPHLHWMCSDTSGSGTTHIVWAIEYTLTNVNGVVATPTIAYSPATATGILNKHMLLEFPAVDISTAKDSAVMLIRVYRAAGLSTDTYNSSAFATDFDLHYQMPNSAAGSLLEYGDN